MVRFSCLDGKVKDMDICGVNLGRDAENCGGTCWNW